MINALEGSQDEGEERRRSYRIDDRIALSYQVLAKSAFKQALARFDEHRRQLGLKNSFIQEKESYLPILKQIEQTNPSIATYLRLLEQKIDALANLLSTENHVLPHAQIHDVTLNAHGIQFLAERFIPSNTQIELRLQLFPSYISLLVYARVVLCKKVDDRDSHRAHAVTVEFNHIHEADQEIIVKHINEKQMLALRNNMESSQS